MTTHPTTDVSPSDLAVMRLGASARGKRRKLSDNPFAEKSPAWRLWRMGYLASKPRRGK